VKPLKGFTLPTVKLERFDDYAGRDDRSRKRYAFPYR
jgi:hypothetical protein